MEGSYVISCFLKMLKPALGNVTKIGFFFHRYSSQSKKSQYKPACSFLVDAPVLKGFEVGFTESGTLFLSVIVNSNSEV